MAATLLSACPINLPVPLTPLVGREREVASVLNLLLHQDVRLLTLTGPGGVGKTRLALHIAAGLEGAFADGIHFVPLAAIRDPALVLPTVAQALGLVALGGQAPAAGLRTFLREREVLLVLDNLEQVVVAAPELVKLLVACPELTMLVTSRESLRVAGEQEFPVPPLAVPDPAKVASPTETASYEAVAYFLQRARAVKPDFALTAANAPTIAAICARLDGLPLALELGAARVKVLPPQALLARLERRLPLLTGGARDLPARQRSMRDAIAWSHDLLAPVEQVLFRRLAVFASGFTLEAAEAVVGGTGGDGTEVVDGVVALVDQSLLRHLGDPGGEPRYAMLETVREYGLERLAASGEEATVRDSHAAYFLDLAERLTPPPWKDSVPVALDRLAREHGNLRAAFTWFHGRGEATPCLRLATATHAFLEARGYLREDRDWLERALALSGEAPALLRATALWQSGWMALQLGDAAAAALAGERALETFRALGDLSGTGSSLVLLGAVALEAGDLDRAERLMEEARAVAQASGDPRGGAALLGNLGLIAALRGDNARARQLYEAHVRAAREAGRDFSAAAGLDNLAVVVLAQGDRRHAAHLSQESLAIYRGLRDPVGLGRSVAIAASLASAAGMAERSARLLGAAEALGERAGTPVSQMDRADHDRDLAHARDGLSEAGFAAAWAAGRALSLEEAVAEAEAVFAAVAARAIPPELRTSLHGLTPRELEVLRLLVEGKTNPAIAAALFVSPRTAETHVTHILGKLGVATRAEAAARAVRDGLA